MEQIAYHHRALYKIALPVVAALSLLCLQRLARGGAQYVLSALGTTCSYLLLSVPSAKYIHSLHNALQPELGATGSLRPFKPAVSLSIFVRGCPNVASGHRMQGQHAAAGSVFAFNRGDPFGGTVS